MIEFATDFAATDAIKKMKSLKTPKTPDDAGFTNHFETLVFFVAGLAALLSRFLKIGPGDKSGTSTSFLK